MTKLDATVLVATYNRAHLLPGTLAALGAQQVPDALAWEILVVDNNSRDHTRQVVAAFAKSVKVPVRYVFESRQGLSYARNRGIQEARGSIIAFTDDDVLPAPDWLAATIKAFATWNADCVGGRILPRWETSPPTWITGNRFLLARLALMDCEESRLLTFPLADSPQVWGANMAFRRELFDRVGAFDTARGMKGTKLVRGEEVELISRALEQGARVAYDPSMVVLHRIDHDRLKKRYFLKIEFDDAENETRLLPAPPGRTFRGVPLWGYRELVTEFWKCLGYTLLGRSDAFSQQLYWFSLLGRASGYAKARRNRATT